MSRVPAMATGWFATMPTGRPPIVAKAVTRFGAQCARSSSRSPSSTMAAHDVSHVVAAGGGGGYARRRPRASAGRSDRRSTTAAAPRRRPTGGRPGSRRAPRGRRPRPAPRGPRSRCWRRGCPLPPSSAVSSDSPVKVSHHPRTAHEGVGVLGHHHLVGQPEEQRRPRQHRPGGGEEHRDPAGAAHQRPGGGAPPVQGGDAFVHVGAARGDDGQQRAARPRARDRPPRRTCDRPPPTAPPGGVPRRSPPARRPDPPAW